MSVKQLLFIFCSLPSILFLLWVLVRSIAYSREHKDWNGGRCRRCGEKFRRVKANAIWYRCDNCYQSVFLKHYNPNNIW